MSGEMAGAEEETYSLKLPLNCIVMKTYGGTDLPLMARGPSQMCCTPVTGRTRWLLRVLQSPLPDFLSASSGCTQVGFS